MRPGGVLPLGRRRPGWMGNGSPSTSILRVTCHTPRQRDGMSNQTAAEYLDQLDALRAAGTPGPWVQHPSDGDFVIGEVSDDGMDYWDVADTSAYRKPNSLADAAL